MATPLRAQCQRITRNPPGYRLRPELGKAIRACPHGNYLIFFTATAVEVVIAHILHGARVFPPLFAAEGQRP